VLGGKDDDLAGVEEATLGDDDEVAVEGSDDLVCWWR
jgi:hypothetical protein